MLDPQTAGIGFVAVMAMLVGVGVAMSRLPFKVKALIFAAMALRVVGALGRESHAADARVYYRWGQWYADYFSRFDFSPFYDPALWRGTSWMGTNFIGYPAGVIASLIGPSWLGMFFAFALIAFAGILCFAVAFKRAFPQIPYLPYWLWLFLLPSLWFWPSSIGKEAIMLLGLGVATLGFVGKHGRISWVVLLLGLAITFVVRPQVAAVFVFAMVLSTWLDFRVWTPERVLQGLVVLVVGLAGIWFALGQTLGGQVDLEALEQYVDENAQRNLDGGSSIEGVGANPANVPQAMINVLLRPFPWEAHTAQALLSALEVLLMWGLLFIRRHRFKAVLKHWRQHRVLRFALPFVLLYVIALGMNLSNLGLMARQRVLVFPFLFLVVEAGALWLRRKGVVVPAVQPPRALAPAGEARPVASLAATSMDSGPVRP